MSESLAAVVDRDAGMEPEPAAVEHRMPRWSRHLRWTIGLAVVVLAAVLRLYRIDDLPPGLFIDQAQYGLDAYRISRGESFPVFVEGPGEVKARGREPLFMYLMAVVFKVVGPTPLAIKLTSALIGIATVAVTYLAATRWLGPRPGALTAALLAVSTWHITFSRLGFRAILAPLWLALVVFALGVLADRRSRAAAAGFGAVVGAGFYTYPAYWSVPPALALVLAAALWERRARRSEGAAASAGLDVGAAAASWRPLATIAAVTCFLVMAPLLAYASTHADDLLARSREVALVGGEGGKPYGQEMTWLRSNAQRVLFMLHLRGDMESRHNIPGRPMLDLVSGLAFLVGLVAVPRAQWPLATRTGLIAFWLLPLVPSAVTVEAPSSLRAIATLPAVCAIAAVGLDATARRLERVPRRAGRVAGFALVAVALAAATVANVRAYFVDWAGQPSLGAVYSADIPRFVEYLDGFARDGEADVVVCPYVFHSPNVEFLTLPDHHRFRPLDSVDALLAGAGARDRVFVCDEPAVNALIQRLYPDAEQLGRYEVYGAHTGRIFGVPAARLRPRLTPPEEEQARHFIARMEATFAERSRAW